MDRIRLVIHMVSIVPEVILLFKAYDLLWMHKKMNLSKKTMIIIISMMISFISNTFFGGDWKSYFIIVMGFYVFSYIYDAKFINRFSYAIQIYCVNVACEVIAVIIISITINVSIKSAQKDIMLYLIGVILSKILVFAYIGLLGFVKRYRLKNFSDKVNVVTIVVTLTSVIVATLSTIFSNNVSDLITFLPIIISTSLLIFSNLILVIEKQEEAESTKERLLFTENLIYKQIKHYDELYSAQDETRKIWHDMNNGLTALFEYIKKEQNEKALIYIESLIGKVTEVVSVVDTGCPAIDSILKSKIKRAEYSYCNIEYEVLISNKLNVDEIDLAVLVANALDNAIEYMQRENMRNKTIYMKMVTRGDYISIKFTNEVNKIIDLKKLTTSKANAIYHGYGLESIKNIANKYEGDVDISCQQNMFFLSILLKNIKNNNTYDTKSHTLA